MKSYVKLSLRHSGLKAVLALALLVVNLLPAQAEEVIIDSIHYECAADTAVVSAADKEIQVADIKPEVTIGSARYKVTAIGSSAFSSCYRLTSVAISESVTSIGSFAFSSCYRLTSVTIPESVTSIGNSAFFGCN